MRSLSPLRYPGGKYSIRNFILSVILANQPIENFVEVYAGGAGLSMYLLQEKYVDQIYLNDKDIFVYSFWSTILNDHDNFIAKLDETPVNLDEWYKQKNIIEGYLPGKYSPLEIGFATFFVNRCNRSGIITKQVGPIGGKKQTGDWKIDARFNKEGLKNRINNIVAVKQHIHFSNLDAIDFLRSNKWDLTKTFFYLDPPYYKKGRTLYREYYDNDSHDGLRNYLSIFSGSKWIVSYDNADYIRDLYSSFSIIELELNHQAQSKKTEKELIIYPESIKITH